MSANLISAHKSVPMSLHHLQPFTFPPATLFAPCLSPCASSRNRPQHCRERIDIGARIHLGDTHEHGIAKVRVIAG
ncbi:MAG: hypothetical protein KatS3mg058_2717 [Roseiflexus sp.]|nr:MAG: hypothetical protein KatS3mg058_2717 [Roseiflexus sp.]